MQLLIRFLLLILGIFIFPVTPASAQVAPDASMSHSVDTDGVNIAINGKSFQTYILQIEQLSYTFAIDAGGCRKIKGNDSYFQGFTTCRITDAAKEEWTVTFKYTFSLADGPHEARLSAPNSEGWQATVQFETGATGTIPTASPIQVTLDPTSIRNDTEHAVKISWTPAESTNYTITTTIPGLETFPLKPCSGSPCTVTITIPADTPTGNHIITITKENTQISGSAELEITSATVSTPPTPAVSGPDMSPTLIPPHPPCNEPTITAGKFTGCKSIFTGLGVAISTNPTLFIRDIFGILLSISGGILLLLIIYSGYQLMTSQGNPERIQAARERITSAIVGFLFLIFSLVLLEVIGVDILRIPGFEKGSGPMPRPGPSGAFPTAKPLPTNVPNCGQHHKAPCSDRNLQNKGCQSGFEFRSGTGTCEIVGG
jgi:hypothetical protein